MSSMNRAVDSTVKRAVELGKVIVYGGQGALGSAVVKHLVSKYFWVANVDFKPNTYAHLNIVVPQTFWQTQEDYVMETLEDTLKTDKVNAVICVANGWEKGNAIWGLSNQIEMLTKKCIWSSTIATTIATKFLTPGGLLVLNGSKLATKPTPNMIGYGMVKAAVHHLTISLGHPYAGLPVNSTVVAILPDTLDTVENRQWMPVADHKTFTPVQFVADLFEQWIKGEDRPESGSLITIETRNQISRATRLLTEMEKE